MTSCAPPKTEPVGDDLQDLQSIALRSTDDDDDDDDGFYKLSWKKQVVFHSPTDVRYTNE